MRIKKYICCGVLPFLILTVSHTEENKLPPQQLQSILDSTSAYCEKLKAAAFHYSCTEKIVETIGTSVQSKKINIFYKMRNVV